MLVAPGRTKRPLHTVAGRDDAEQCPFCPGSENETPPESEAIRADGSAPNGPGWTARAFPNKFPAAKHHEVLVEGPRHLAGPDSLTHDEWVASLTLIRNRILDFERRPEVRCAFWFKNVGRHAGASVAHNHSQLLGLPILPPRLELELDAQRNEGPLIEDDLDRSNREGRRIVDGPGFSWLSPTQPKLPFETWIVPHDRTSTFEDADLGDLAQVLSRATKALKSTLEEPPFNLYLHRVPNEEFHWHFEMQPRTGFLAALELGGDMYINSMPAQEASARFRDHLGSSPT